MIIKYAWKLLVTVVNIINYNLLSFNSFIPGPALRLSFSAQATIMMKTTTETTKMSRSNSEDIPAVIGIMGTTYGKRQHNIKENFAKSIIWEKHVCMSWSRSIYHLQGCWL